MTRTITANVVSRKTVTDLAVIDWDDDKYGEPTEENVLKALEDLQVDFADVIDTDDSVEEYLDVFDIERRGGLVMKANAGTLLATALACITGTLLLSWATAQSLGWTITAAVILFGSVIYLAAQSERAEEDDED